MVTPVKKSKAGAPASKQRMTDEEKALADKLQKAKVAKAEAARLDKEATAEKAKQKKAAEAEAAKVKKAAEEKAAKDKAEKALLPAAKEINTRFDKANELGVKVDDHRLAAAIRLATVKDTCREEGIPYKDWCAKNLKVSEQTIRKMLPIGAAENEKEGAGKLMLEDLRNANKDANKKSRDKKKAEASTGGSAPKTPERKVPAGERALAATDAMPEGEKKAFLSSQAESVGMKLVDPNEATPPASKKVDVKSPGLTPLEAAEQAFNALAPRRRIAFVYWAADVLNGKFVPAEGNDDTGADADTDITDIPAALKK